MSVLVALQPAGGAFTSTATWDQAPATWAATATESFLSTATYVQAAATWQATASEAYPSSATWLQAAATWSAVANEAFAATGSFVQAAAAWNAIATETLASTATWLQAAASWDASAAVGAAGNAFTASWLQAAATWAASSTQGCDEGFQADAFQADAFQECAPVVSDTGMGGRYGRYERAIVRRYQEPVRTPEPVLMAAAWSQQPAGWKADMETFEDETWFLLFDDLVLSGAR
jgi:hypothetical protein